MNDATASLFCPNFSCQTLNLETQRVCRQCHTPLPRRYLWIAQGDLPGYGVGRLIGDRYLLKSPHVALDTRPGLPPATPTEIPEGVLPYLRLFPQRLHLPQPYSLLLLDGKSPGSVVLLLESAPLAITSNWVSHPTVDPLLPSLAQAWPQASALRQLNWLWQLAELWQPLKREGAAASLFNPQLLRVEGPLVRLLELDTTQSMHLAQLGQLWSTWTTTAHPDIAPLLTQLSQQLQAGSIATADGLLHCLDQAIQVIGQTQTCRISLATQTDQGPSRQRNEDACYPAGGTQQTLTLGPGTAESALTLVCDGIGGHEGGDIASNLAIQSIQQQVQGRAAGSLVPATQLTAHLEQAVCLANDAISQRNDGERRQERQRMGTTLVMALASAYDLYVTHVGDSRVYWVTRYGCHQITVDDDLASREVRLGYAFYRDALELSTSGSLVQALGMSHSANLHPTVQRFLLDEDSVFLLCSDGLSDNDRVETVWDTELLPILQGNVDVAVASQRLIEVANRQNGHDNATVSVLHCQPQLRRSLTTAELTTLLDYSLNPDDREPGSPSQVRTQLMHSPQRSRRWLWLILLGLPILSAGSALLFWIIRSSNTVSNESSPVNSPASPPPPPVEPPLPAPLPPPLSVGTLVQLIAPVTLLPQPGAGVQRSPLPSLPRGTLLQLASKQELPTQGTWLKLTLCAIPGSKAAATPSALRPGTPGWIQEQGFTASIQILPPGTVNCPVAAPTATPLRVTPPASP